MQIKNGFHAFVFGPPIKNGDVRVFSLLLSNSLEIPKNKLTKAKSPPKTCISKIEKCKNGLTICIFKRSGKMGFRLCFFGDRKSYFSNWCWDGEKWAWFTSATQRVYKDASTFTDSLTDQEFNNWKDLFFGNIESRKVALTMAYEVGKRVA